MLTGSQSVRHAQTFKLKNAVDTIKLTIFRHLYTSIKLVWFFESIFSRRGLLPEVLGNAGNVVILEHGDYNFA